MFKTKFRISIILSMMIIALAVIASAGGIFIEDLYRDNELTKAAWYGNDIVTLFVAVPMMVWSLALAMKDSQKAQLVWMGTLWYMVYNYIFYLYGAAFNNFFLLYVALFTMSTYALIFALINFDIKALAPKLQKGMPVKWISGYMFVFPVFLGGMWIAKSIGVILSGELPQDIIQTGHTTAMVYATDLSLLMPAVVLGGILLLKRNPWGYVISTIVMIKCITYVLVLLVMSLVCYIRLGQPDAYTALWAFLGAGALICLLSLLKNMKSTGKNREIIA